MAASVLHNGVARASARAHGRPRLMPGLRGVCGGVSSVQFTRLSFATFVAEAAERSMPLARFSFAAFAVATFCAMQPQPFQWRIVLYIESIFAFFFLSPRRAVLGAKS
jgi:hypothetical protein